MPIKILIADDHPLIADGIKNTFENQLDFDVVAVVNNGQEAIHTIQNNHIDIALLDINMPVMDGITATKKIINVYGKARPKLIAMNANGFKEDREKCFEAGMDNFISKPVDIHELEQVIHEYS